MISKNQIKHINALKLKKNRQAEGLFIAEGVKVVEEMVYTACFNCELFATASFLNRNASLLNDKQIKFTLVTAEELKKISALTTPNEVLAICKIPQITVNPQSLITKLSLVLDDIKDPGNLGTIIRIADWFGIEHIICSSETVDAFNAKVVQATMGSIARVNLMYTDLPVFFNHIHRLTATTAIMPVYGALLDGDTIYSQQLSENGFIVIGNESKGISPGLLPFITQKIKIPAFGTNLQTAESLNAAIATAIICSEFKRKSLSNC